MRVHSLTLSVLAIAALGACNGSDVTTPARPPLAGVRFINSLADTTAVDIRMVDQLEYSAVANNINFRAGTEHQPIEAKARHIKVFAFNGANPTIDNVTQVLLDTTVTFTANTKVTMLLAGSARAKTVHFVMINDDQPAPAAGQIAVRVVNASTGAIDAYVTDTTTTAISGTPTAANVAPATASPLTSMAIPTRVALRFTDAGSTTVSASQAGPKAPSGPAGAAPAAGINTEGTIFSVYYFPAGVAGSPQKGVTAPSAVWFVDRVPTP